MSKNAPAQFIPPELQHELDIRDESNPHSLVNLLPGKMAESLRSIPDQVLGMTATDLKRLGNIGTTEERLRHAFWMEYNYASIGKRKINMPNVYNGVCRREYWWQRILTDTYKMAYIFLPPPNYRVQLSELLDVGLEQLRDILLRPHLITDMNGNQIVDARLAGVKAKIVEGLQNRVHGQTVQRVQSETKTLKVGVQVEKGDSLEDIDRKLAQAEAALKGGSSGRKEEAKDVTPLEIEMSEMRIEGLESASESDDQE